MEDPFLRLDIQQMLVGVTPQLRNNIKNVHVPKTDIESVCDALVLFCHVNSLTHTNIYSKLKGRQFDVDETFELLDELLEDIGLPTTSE